MRRSETYNCTGALVVGVILITLGAVLFCTQIPLFAEDLGIPSGAVGFWSGLYFILLGTIEIWSSRNSGHHLIIAVMVLAIVGYFVAFAGGLVAMMLLLVGTPSGYYHSGGATFNYKLYDWISYSQLALCMTESFLCIAAAVLCCKGVCSCCGATSQESHVVYTKAEATDAEGRAITGQY